MDDFEYLCRACAANTRSKSSIVECVYILKTPKLVEKLEKYLHLKVSATDRLPKVLCKACFRQVESTASLSQIAEHMQTVLADYLVSDMAKSQRNLQSQKKTLTRNNEPSTKSAIAEFEKPLTLPAETAVVVAAATGANATFIYDATSVANPAASANNAAAANNAATAASAAAIAAALKKDEVIVNVSVSDPLTRETQQKMISSAAQRQVQKASSTFTPKSIAQRGFTNNTLRYGENMVPYKKPSPPGIINFLNGQPQQVTTFSSGGYIIGDRAPSAPATQTAPAVDASSPMHTHHSEIGAKRHSAKTLQRKRKNLDASIEGVSRAAAAAAATPVGMGQVSLLKTLSQRNAVQESLAPAPPKKPPTPPVLKLCQNDDEELPVQMIIAAAKKKKEKQQQQQRDKKQRAKQRATIITSNTNSNTDVPVPSVIAVEEPKPKKRKSIKSALTEASTTTTTTTTAAAVVTTTIPTIQTQTQAPTPPTTTTIPATTTIPTTTTMTMTPRAKRPSDDIVVGVGGGGGNQVTKINTNPELSEQNLLGNIIRDPDLLKLILKALQWPVTKLTLELQMARLRNSKFNDIMSDPNLLQDADLTQILGPVMAAAMKQQRLAAAAAAASFAAASASLAAATAAAATAIPVFPKQQHNVSLPNGTDIQTAEQLAKAIPYKLPAETSVQLVPASPEEENSSSSSMPLNATPAVLSLKHARKIEQPRRKVRHALKSSSGIVLIRDMDDITASNTTTATAINSSSSSLTATTTTATGGSSCNSNSSSSSKSNFSIGNDNAFFTQLALFSNDKEAERMRWLKRQNASLLRPQLSSQHKLNSNSNKTADNDINAASLSDIDDDIVLIETQNVPEAKPPTDETAYTSSTDAKCKKVVDFILPTTTRTQEPVAITRPVNKRRKTVIASTTATSTESSIKDTTLTSTTTTAAVAATSSTSVITTPTTTPITTTTPTTTAIPTTTPIITTTSTTTNTTAAAVSIVPTTPELEVNQTDNSKDTKETKDICAPVSAALLTIATQVSGVALSKQLTSMANTNTTATTTTSGVCSLLKSKQQDAAAPSSSKTVSKKLHTSKSALGQQLLHAIGLQQMSSGSSIDGSTAELEASTSRGSVKHIRSLLKMSLKQAVEQQQLTKQRKHDEPIKQDADSSTKNIVKETLIEAKDTNTAAEVGDVEDLIDKVKLTIEENKIKTDESLAEIEQIKPEAKEKSVRKPKEKIVNLSSSSSALSPTTTTTTTTQSSSAISPETGDEPRDKLPKKRGRKSKKEKQEAEEIAAKRDLTIDSDSDSTSGHDLPSTSSFSESLRPSRISKTLSKYYKGPDKQLRDLPRRSNIYRASRLK